MSFLNFPSSFFEKSGIVNGEYKTTKKDMEDIFMERGKYNLSVIKGLTSLILEIEKNRSSFLLNETTDNFYIVKKVEHYIKHLIKKEEENPILSMKINYKTTHFIKEKNYLDEYKNSKQYGDFSRFSRNKYTGDTFFHVFQGAGDVSKNSYYMKLTSTSLVLSDILEKYTQENVNLICSYVYLKKYKNVTVKGKTIVDEFPSLMEKLSHHHLNLIKMYRHSGTFLLERTHWNPLFESEYKELDKLLDFHFDLKNKKDINEIKNKVIPRTREWIDTKLSLMNKTLIAAKHNLPFMSKEYMKIELPNYLNESEVVQLEGSELNKEVERLINEDRVSTNGMDKVQDEWDNKNQDYIKRREEFIKKHSNDTHNYTPKSLNEELKDIHSFLQGGR